MALSFNKDLRLPEGQYNIGKHKKSGICVHHTVGGTAESTFNWWNSNTAKVGTAYIIDRDGTLLEVFDPEYWAWQFGLKIWGNADRYAFERRFIGIELASEGGIIENNGKFYCYDRISPRTEKSADEIFDFGKNYRSYRYYDRYEPAQIETLTELVNHLCDRFDIPRRVLHRPMDYYGQEIKDFEGIIGHVNVRKDKTDPSPSPELWETLKTECRLSLNGDASVPRTDVASPLMTHDEINELFTHNVGEINRMHIPAGSMVKGLIMELERKNRNTYIKLRDAESNGHIVFYDFVEGDKELVSSIGRALGFKQITSDKLEVHNA